MPASLVQLRNLCSAKAMVSGPAALAVRPTNVNFPHYHSCTVALILIAASLVPFRECTTRMKRVWECDAKPVVVAAYLLMLHAAGQGIAVVEGCSSLGRRLHLCKETVAVVLETFEHGGVARCAAAVDSACDCSRVQIVLLWAARQPKDVAEVKRVV